MSCRTSVFLVFVVSFGRGSTYFIAFGCLVFGSVEDAFSVLTRLLLSGSVLAGIIDDVVLRFLDDRRVAVESLETRDMIPE